MPCKDRPVVNPFSRTASSSTTRMRMRPISYLMCWDANLKVILNETAPVARSQQRQEKPCRAFILDAEWRSLKSALSHARCVVRERPFGRLARRHLGKINDEFWRIASAALPGASDPACLPCWRAAREATV